MKDRKNESSKDISFKEIGLKNIGFKNISFKEIDFIDKILDKYVFNKGVFKWDCYDWFIASAISLLVSLIGYAISNFLCGALLVSSRLYLAINLPFFASLVISFCVFAISGDFIMQRKKNKQAKAVKNDKLSKRELRSIVTVVDNVIYIEDKVA